jgi:hypothetical protein
MTDDATSLPLCSGSVQREKKDGVWTGHGLRLDGPGPCVTQVKILRKIFNYLDELLRDLCKFQKEDYWSSSQKSMLRSFFKKRYLAHPYCIQFVE